MLGSFERPTTGRWMFWPPCSLCCTQPEWIVMGKTSSGDLLLTKGNLMLDLSIRLLLAKRLFIFPEKYLADQGPRESGFLCLDGRAREDLHLGQSQKEACHSN
jgi:hypothetical protein